METRRALSGLMAELIPLYSLKVRAAFIKVQVRKRRRKHCSGRFRFRMRRRLRRRNGRRCAAAQTHHVCKQNAQQYHAPGHPLHPSRRKIGITPSVHHCRSESFHINSRIEFFCFLWYTGTVTGNDLLFFIIIGYFLIPVPTHSHKKCGNIFLFFGFRVGKRVGYPSKV